MMGRWRAWGKAGAHPGRCAARGAVQAIHATRFTFSTTVASRATPVHSTSESGANVAISRVEQGRSSRAALALPKSEELHGYVFFGTRLGTVKRVTAADLVKATGNVFNTINVDEADSLEWVRVTLGGGEVVLVTTQDKRSALPKKRFVRWVSMRAACAASASASEMRWPAWTWYRRAPTCWCSARTGTPKRATLAQYPAQGRAGKGVVSAKAGATSGR